MIRKSLWARVQETPLELALAATAVLVSAGRLTVDGSTLAVFALALWSTLLVGGSLTIYGRLGCSLSAESAGLALLMGAYWFTALRSFGRAETGSALMIEVFRYGSISIGLAVRLWVVRRAAKAARVVANG